MFSSITSSLRWNRAQWAWILVDWGNSAYATSVMAGFFPILFKSYYAYPLNSTESTSWLGLSLSITSVFLAVTNPIIGWLTDHKPWNKKGVLFFSGLSWCGILGLILAKKGHWQMALWSYGLSLVGFNLSMSLYDALLKYVTYRSEEHRLSATGYAAGYLGGGLLFLGQVLFIQSHAAWGVDDPVDAVKWAFASVIVWWALWSLPLIFWIKERSVPELKNVATPKPDGGGHAAQTQGNPLGIRFYVQSLVHDTKHLLQNKSATYFLLAYWLYIDVVYTIINMATDYATALGLEAKDLMKALLLVQFLGFPATAIMGYLTKYWSAKRILIGLLLIYVIIIVWSYFLTRPWHFWTLASLIAVAQGGVQSLSRSLFARILQEKESGYGFGLFNMVGRMASITGPLVLAGMTYGTSSHRLGMLSLLPLLLGGLWILRRVKVERA